MANVTFLDDLAAGYTPHDINFDADPLYNKADVLPDARDSLAQLVEKAARWERIVTSGRSLAVAFGMLEENAVELDYEALGRDAMTTVERELYDNWRAGGKAKPINAATDTKTWTGKTTSEKRDRFRLAALQTLTQNKKLGLDNLQWFYANRPTLIPLICAIEKVAAQRRQFTQGGTRDARELKEQQAARRAVGTAGAITNRYMEEIKKLTRRIDNSLQAVHARKVAVSPAETNAGKKKVPANERRSALSLPTISMPSQWRGEEGAGRLQRIMAEPTPAPAPVAGPSRPRQSRKRATNPYNNDDAVARRTRSRYDPEREASPEYRPTSPLQPRNLGSLDMSAFDVPPPNPNAMQE